MKASYAGLFTVYVSYWGRWISFAPGAVESEVLGVDNKALAATAKLLADYFLSLSTSRASGTFDLLKPALLLLKNVNQILRRLTRGPA